MPTNSVEELLDYAEKQGLELWEAVLHRHLIDEQRTRDESIAKMEAMWLAMCGASGNYVGSERSESGLSGGNGELLASRAGSFITGDFIGTVMTEAMKMGECNACMKRIVAAPTAGSCGVLPAVLIAFKKHHGVSDEDIVKALFVAAGFGQVIAARASVSGAEGGCQAEIGSASAMAAAAVVSIKGGSAEACSNAAALALQSFLGLVCDPVAGLVEVPCIVRGVSGAVTAITSADMSLAGVRSMIPCDEVIDAMREVGDLMHTSLKETGQAGLAATKTAMEFTKGFTIK